ncbi:spermidine synthase [Myxococcaceae bacterium GXIMD 01537]
MHGSTGFPKNLVSSFLFLSGATALVYELVWSKYLANVLGNSGQAHAVVLATFMGGLALGAYVFGRTADRVKSPLAMYGLLELGVGLYALIFPAVLDALGAAYLAVAGQVPDGARVVPRLLLAALSLVVPTLLMGGTLPALVRHFSSSLSGVQRELARLYALNSLGAALGAFLAGTSLVPTLGLALSAQLAAVLNIVLALGALALARRHPPALAPGEEAPPTGEGDVTYPRAAVRAALVGVLVSGFTSMLYQVTWIRLLAIVLGASTYAFTLILTAFILGIGLGSFWLMTRKPGTDSLRLFGWLQVALVVSVCVALPLYLRLPYMFRRAHEVLSRTQEAWSYYQLLTFGFACAVLLVPTFFMGAAFPAAARVATARVQELGRQLGGVYLWNTMGTITGSALGGLVLMPWWGMDGNFMAGVAGSLVAAGLALYAAPGRTASPVRALWPVGAVAVLALLCLGGMRGWPVLLSSMSVNRLQPTAPRSYESMVASAENNLKPLFYQDDTFASVLVADQVHVRNRFLQLNGKVDASNGEDMDMQVLAGHLGALLHPRDPKNVLVIGVGSGVTAGSVLTHSVEHLDLVDISGAVIEGARLFGADNRNVLEDPRTHVHIDDAKTFMALAPRRYDLIISEPSNPWVAGVAGLFTRDFFQKVDKHLTDDGVMVQWIHTYENSEELVQLVIRTLRDTFPHATTWLGPADLIFVASRKPLPFDAKLVAERLLRPEVRGDIARAGVHDVFGLLSRQVHSAEGQLDFAGPGPINTDDLNILEYAAPVAWFIGKPKLSIHDERRSPDSGARLLLTEYLRGNPPTAQQAEHLYKALSRWHPMDDPLLLAAATLWRSLTPDSPDSALALANVALVRGNRTLAESLLEPLVAGGNRDPAVLAIYLRMVAGRSGVSRSVWTPVDASAAVALGQEAVAAHPKNEDLAKALQELCENLQPSACASKTPAVAAPAAP